MKEEVERYRIVIGNQTCVFEKENDPTILRSPSAGKLIGFLVEDGGHVYKGQAYAEIEVSVYRVDLHSDIKMSSLFLLILLGDEDGNDPYSRRGRFCVLREETRSCFRRRFSAGQSGIGRPFAGDEGTAVQRHLPRVGRY